MSDHSFENSPARRAFVVIGMHRSGTSAMTRTLSLLGAALPKQLMPAVNENNTTGFWEPQAVADFNDEILQALDSEWDDVFAFRPRHYLSNFDRVYRGRAVEILDQQFNGAEVIVLKDPRISVLTGLWDRALSDAGYKVHYVVMVRNPLEVADSLRARDGFPREKSFLLWSSYMIAIDRDTRKHARTFVSYRQLMSDWRAVRRRIESVTAVPFPRDTATAAIEVDRFLDAQMYHHQARDEDLFSRADVPEQLKTLYRIFSEACDGADVDSAALAKIERELEELDLLVGPLLADLKGSARALSNKVAELTDENAAARERANLVEEQLAAEQTRREKDEAARSQLSDDYEVRLAQLSERVAALQAERDDIARIAEEKGHFAGELAAAVARAEAERNRLAEEVGRNARAAEAMAERLAAVERDLGRKEGELLASQELLSSTRAQVVTLTDLLRKAEREAELVRRQAEEARTAAEAAARASDVRLSEQYREISKLTELLENSENQIQDAKRDAEESRKSADSIAKVNEEKLMQRFQEVGALTKLLKQQEERGIKTEDHVRWLVALHEGVAGEPQWWSLLPRAWARRRTLRRLRNTGLFDSDAYLQLYPDVAAAGKDPLDHYLEHGYYEGRSRPC